MECLPRPTRRSRSASPVKAAALNPTTPTDFSISIKGSCNASTGTVKLSHYTDPNFVGQAGHQSFLQGPEGSTDGGLHSILHTVRIPLTDFPGYGNAFSTRVPGIRLTFDQSSQGAIYVANIRQQRLPAGQKRTLTT